MGVGISTILVACTKVQTAIVVLLTLASALPSHFKVYVKFFFMLWARLSDEISCMGIGIHRQYEKKIFCFRTTWFRCLKFGIVDCIVELFQVCSDGGLRDQKALLLWVLGLNS